MVIFMANKLLILFFLLVSVGTANATVHYSYAEIHDKDFLGKIFPDAPKYQVEYNGQVDRHVLCAADYLNDTTILISKAIVPDIVVKPEVIEKIICVEREEEPAVIVKTYWEEED